GVRIAVSVDHQVLQRRNVDDAELPAAGAVAVELLEIGLGHARTLAGTTDTDDANEGADPPATALLGAVGRPTMPLWLCGLCSLCGALRLLRHRRPSRDRIARAPGLACRPRWWWRSSSCIARAPGARFSDRPTRATSPEHRPCAWGSLPASLRQCEDLHRLLPPPRHPLGGKFVGGRGVLPQDMPGDDLPVHLVRTVVDPCRTRLPVHLL